MLVFRGIFLNVFHPTESTVHSEVAQNLYSTSTQIASFKDSPISQFDVTPVIALRTTSCWNTHEIAHLNYPNDLVFTTATVPPVIILGKVQIIHQHQKLQAIFWFVFFFSPYKNPHPFFVDLLRSLSSSKLCQVETASSRKSSKAWANLGSMESTCKVSSVASWHEWFKGQRFGMEKEGVLRIEHNDDHHHHHHHRHHSHHRHHF